MKNLIKVATILLISVMVMLFATTVNAADNDAGFTDLTGTLNNTSNNTSSNNTSSNNTSGNTNTGNTNSNSNNSNTNTNKNTNTNNTNSSKYNNTNKNTDLPKTGIEDSIPVALLVVVFGISAVYAYKKINEYKNI